MLVLINDILDLSKIEAGRLELEEKEINIRDSVHTSLEVVAQKAAAKGLHIVSYVSPTVPVVILTDPVRLKQVLFNLLSNSVKFTAQGFVLIKVEAETTEHSSTGTRSMSDKSDASLLLFSDSMVARSQLSTAPAAEERWKSTAAKEPLAAINATAVIPSPAVVAGAIPLAQDAPSLPSSTPFSLGAVPPHPSPSFPF